jgi:hypothetical protein
VVVVVPEAVGGIRKGRETLLPWTLAMLISKRREEGRREFGDGRCGTLIE